MSAEHFRTINMYMHNICVLCAIYFEYNFCIQEDISGRCETTYTCLDKVPLDQYNSRKSTSSKIFKVLKTKNFENCEVKPMTKHGLLSNIPIEDDKDIDDSWVKSIVIVVRSLKRNWGKFISYSI